MTLANDLTAIQAYSSVDDRRRPVEERGWQLMQGLSRFETLVRTHSHNRSLCEILRMLPGDEMSLVAIELAAVVNRAAMSEAAELTTSEPVLTALACSLLDQAELKPNPIQVVGELLFRIRELLPAKATANYYSRS
jgi:hypothetical protein